VNVFQVRCSENAREKLVDVARNFFNFLFSGEPERAQRLITSDFTWFGNTKLSWSNDRIRNAVGEEQASLGPSRLVEKGMVGLLSEEDRARAFGEITKDDEVVLVDLNNRDQTSTVAVVVTMTRQGPAVKKVLDAMPFREVLERDSSKVDPESSTNNR